MSPDPDPRSHFGTRPLNREERRRARKLGMVGPPESPIPCQCPNGHRWYAPGYFQKGTGTFFDNDDDRWCPECDRPEEFSAELGPRPEGATDG